MPRIGLLLSCVTPPQCPVKVGCSHVTEEEKMRPAVGLLVQTPQQQLTQKVLGDRHTLGVLNSVLPNHLVSFGGHTGMWMLFGEIISTLAQTIASPPPHTWGAASGTMAKENGVQPYQSLVLGPNPRTERSGKHAGGGGATLFLN